MGELRFEWSRSVVVGSARLKCGYAAVAYIGSELLKVEYGIMV
jgi:hypothetical protein